MAGGSELKNDVLKKAACTFCGACLDWCPFLTNIDDHLVMPFECNIKDGRCYAVCPRTFTDWEIITKKFIPENWHSTEIGTFTKVLKAKSATPIHNCQDGGTVTGLVKGALSTNIAGVALLTGAQDAITPQPLLADNLAEIEKTAGSRFLANGGLRKLSGARLKNEKGLVVVGRPCQIQALRKMQFNGLSDLPADEVLSIGLFCAWSLSWTFKEHLENQWPGIQVNHIAILEDRIEVYSAHTTITLPIDAVRKFIRPGCNYCLDLTSELADLSVGALPAEPGWNTVIVRTRRGEELLNKTVDGGFLVIEPYPETELDKLKQGALHKKKRSLKTIDAAVKAGLLSSFINLSASPYRELLEQGKREVKH